MSTFGIGGELTDAQWRSVIRQLLVRNYLHADVERYGALVLTERSRPLLRGDVTLHLREDPTAPVDRANAAARQPVAEDRHRALECAARLPQTSSPTRRTFRRT